MQQVCGYWLAQGIIDSTVIKAQRRSFSNAPKSKGSIKSCLLLFNME